MQSCGRFRKSIVQIIVRPSRLGPVTAMPGPDERGGFCLDAGDASVDPGIHGVDQRIINAASKVTVDALMIFPGTQTRAAERLSQFCLYPRLAGQNPAAKRPSSGARIGPVHSSPDANFEVARVHCPRTIYTTHCWITPCVSKSDAERNIACLCDSVQRVSHLDSS